MKDSMSWGRGWVDADILDFTCLRCLPSLLPSCPLLSLPPWPHGDDDNQLFPLTIDYFMSFFCGCCLKNHYPLIQTLSNRIFFSFGQKTCYKGWALDPNWSVHCLPMSYIICRKIFLYNYRLLNRVAQYSHFSFQTENSWKTERMRVVWGGMCGPADRKYYST